MQEIQDQEYFPSPTDVNLERYKDQTQAEAVGGVW